MRAVTGTDTGYAPTPEAISRSRLASRTAFCSAISSRAAASAAARASSAAVSVPVSASVRAADVPVVSVMVLALSRGDGDGRVVYEAGRADPRGDEGKRLAAVSVVDGEEGV